MVKIKDKEEICDTKLLFAKLKEEKKSTCYELFKSLVKDFDFTLLNDELPKSFNSKNPCVKRLSLRLQLRVWTTRTC